MRAALHVVSRDFTPSPKAMELARRALARDAVSKRVDDTEFPGAALQRACALVSENLRDAMGEAGCTALIARARARTEGDHPALKKLQRVNEGCLHLDGVVESVEAHGIGDVTAALEALLAALADILIRLIGEDMAVTLINREAPSKRNSGGVLAP